jgi:hypothetical protein
VPVPVPVGWGRCDTQHIDESGMTTQASDASAPLLIQSDGGEGGVAGPGAKHVLSEQPIMVAATQYHSSSQPLREKWATVRARVLYFPGISGSERGGGGGSCCLEQLALCAALLLELWKVGIGTFLAWFVPHHCNGTGRQGRGPVGRSSNHSSTSR